MIKIKTDRLSLRPIHRRDAPRFAELCSDILIARNTARVPHPYGLKDAEKFVRFAEEVFASDKEYPFAVCKDALIIACAGVSLIGKGVFELGYWVGVDYRGSGIATEAASAVAQFAIDKKRATQLHAGYFADNPTSGSVLQKLGFEPTGEVVKMHSVGRGCEADVIRLSVDAAKLVRSCSVRYA